MCGCECSPWICEALLTQLRLKNALKSSLPSLTKSSAWTVTVICSLWRGVMFPCNDLKDNWQANENIDTGAFSALRVSIASRTHLYPLGHIYIPLFFWHHIKLNVWYSALLLICARIHLLLLCRCKSDRNQMLHFEQPWAAYSQLAAPVILQNVSRNVCCRCLQKFVLVSGKQCRLLVLIQMIREVNTSRKVVQEDDEQNLLVRSSLAALKSNKQVCLCIVHEIYLLH